MAARLPLRLSLIYAVVAGAYIIVSDRAVAALAPAGPYATTFQTAKGVAFVIVTAAVMYLLTRQLTRAVNHQSAARERADVVRAAIDRRNTALIEALGEVVYDHDVTRDHIDWGGDTVRSLGSSVEELGHGANGWLGRVHPDDQQRVSDEFQRPGSTLFHVEYRMRHGGGHYVWMLDRGVVTRDAEQRITRVTGVMWDITERRHAADTLRESEERFRQLAENINEVFWFTDVAANSLIYVSSGYERIWGRSREELLASPSTWMEAIHPDDRPHVIRAVAARALAADYDVEYRIIRPDGEERWIHDRAFPVRNDSGVVYRVAGVADDITGRKQLEEQLRQAQKMEAVGQLAGGVAHDFNNLLTIIIGYSDLLLAQLSADDPSYDSVSEIRKAGERSAVLTRQLLALGRKQPLAPEEIDVNDVIRNSDRMLRLVLGDQGELILRLGNDTNHIRADPGPFEQVLLNLVVNARDAMPNGGTVTIETANDKVDGHLATDASAGGDATHVRVSVTDTGVGMTDEVKGRVFEPFFTTKPAGKGTGLGLAVAHGFVTQSGGRIAVVSDLDRGTTFHMYFPRVDPIDRDDTPQT
jgi:PAS domain S-box-containing protein